MLLPALVYDFRSAAARKVYPVGMAVCGEFRIVCDQELDVFLVAQAAQGERLCVAIGGTKMTVDKGAFFRQLTDGPAGVWQAFRITHQDQRCEAGRVLCVLTQLLRDLPQGWTWFLCRVGVRRGHGRK